MSRMTGGLYATVSTDSADACPPTTTRNRSPAPMPGTLSQNMVTWSLGAASTRQLAAVYTTASDRAKSAQYWPTMPTVPAGPKLSPRSVTTSPPSVRSSSSLSHAMLGSRYRTAVPLKGALVCRSVGSTVTSNVRSRPMPGAARHCITKCAVAATRVQLGLVYLVPAGA